MLSQLIPNSATLAVLAGLANLLALAIVARALSPKDQMAARARALADRRTQLRRRLLMRKRPEARSSINLARQVLERLRLTRGAEAAKAATLLTQAGWRSKDAVVVFLSLRLMCPILLGGVAYLLAPRFAPDAATTLRLTISLGGAAAGAYLPTLLLRNAISKRSQKIRRGLPDALDLFVICAEAGLSLDAAIARVAREIGATAPDLAEELGITAVELGFLPDRREALTNFARRADSPAVRGLVNTLAQTEKYGTPLAQSLRVLAAEFRDTRMLEAEAKASRLPATLTAPLIMFILPPLFVVLLGPAIIQVVAAL
jgi:tight adherence protein C